MWWVLIETKNDLNKLKTLSLNTAVHLMINGKLISKWIGKWIYTNHENLMQR